MIVSDNIDMLHEDEEVEKGKNRVELDAILENDLGQFGKFQLKLMIICSAAAVFSAWAAGEYLFTAAKTNSRCLILECDPSTPEFYAPWVKDAIPTSSGTLDNCQRFAANVSQSTEEQICFGIRFNQKQTVNCEKYVYENTDSVVYDFGLACNEWKRTLIGSMRTFGTLLALPLTGQISDRWGRRVTLTITGFNGAWLGAARYFTDTYIGFIILQVVEATVSSGLYATAFILLLEALGTKYRSIAGAIMKSVWAIGHMTLGLIAWKIPNWRTLTLTVFLPELFVILFPWFVSESPRWYMSQRRYTEAVTVMQKMAKSNGTTFCLRSGEVLKSLPDEEEITKYAEKREDKEPWLIVTLFKHKKVLVTCIVVSVWWITDILIYYGLSINAVNMMGNKYLNYVAVSAAEIPGFWIGVLLIDRLGRKLILTCAFWTCAACQAVYILIPREYFGLSVTFYFVGKCSISVVTFVIYIYTAELYPTKHRHTLFAFNSMVGRIGSIIAPLTPAIGDATFEVFPFVVFGSLALLSGLLTFFTPETLGAKLPETLEEAENL